MTEMCLTSDTDIALAKQMLDSWAATGAVSDHSDEEIFTALLHLICIRIMREKNPSVVAERVCAMLRANFPPERH
jgi:hypothetical protein